LATISRRRLATEQKRDPVGAHCDGGKPEVPDTGMKLPTRMEQGQTERKVPASAQVGCSAESRLEQKEGYGWHANFFDVCMKQVHQKVIIETSLSNISGRKRAKY